MKPKMTHWTVTWKFAQT